MKNLIRTLLLLAVPLLLAAGGAPARGAMYFQTEMGQRSGDLKPKPAWFDGSRVHYWDFGVSPARSADLFRAITGLDENGKPEFLEGQQSIFDSIPGDAGYSDFWQMVFYAVQPGYPPNAVRSLDQIKASGFQLIRAEQVVNCPIVEADTVAGEETLRSGWVAGRQIHYFTFGQEPKGFPGGPSNIYFFASGFRADGSPVLASNALPVLDKIPDSADYSALRRVNYVLLGSRSAGSAPHSAAGLLASGLQVRPTDTFMNLPNAAVPARTIPKAAWWAVPGFLLFVAAALFHRALKSGKRTPS